MTPAVGVDHARWVVDALIAGSGVAAIVPTGFEAHARILHPLAVNRRWADVAPLFLGAGDEAYDYPYEYALIEVEGNLAPQAADALAAALAPSTPGWCHFGLWDGWGWTHAGASGVYFSSADDGPAAARALEDLQERHERSMRRAHSFVAACPLSDDVGGGRPMRLFDGPLQAVGTIGYDPFGDGSFTRQSPQWWWPSDRTWFVATEIDYPWTYLAGPERLVAEVLASLPAESARTPDARW